MNITSIHIAGGVIALVCGAVAVSVRKGSAVHVSAGTWFCVAMLVLGVTASILAPFKSPPDSPVGGIMVCYFVATAWMTAATGSRLPSLRAGSSKARPARSSYPPWAVFASSPACRT